MVGSLGEEFQASASFGNAQSVAPIFDMPEPEITTTVTINPDLLNGADGASLLQGVGAQALSGPVQNQSILGDVFGAMENLANDVRDTGNQIAVQEQLVEVVNQPVETAPTPQNQVYTQAAAELQQNAQMPSPSMA